MSPPRGPVRALPLLYLGTAHAALAAAFLFAAVWPGAVAGFFYHAWLIGLVHLVTLGWISFSILGAIYIVAPLALRTDMPAQRSDYVAWAVAVVGLVGMVGHFWIQQYPGMAWSAATVAAGILYMTGRIVARIRGAPIQPPVKLHIVLACVNFWLAAAMGLLIAFDKSLHFLPGFVMANVFAHAHLAALGWATMMVVGVAYRLLPMILPARMPTGRSLYASAVLLEVGVLGLFVTLLIRSALSALFAAIVVAGLAAFGAHVARMRSQPVPPPVGAPRPDFAVLHAAAAGISLAIACGIGLVLATQPTSPTMLDIAAAYGVLGLVGFLAQMVVAMEARLLPMVTWFWTYAATGYQVPPPSPHAMRERWLQTMVFIGWTAGVPLLALGMFRESAVLVRAGGWSLFVAVVIATLDNVFVVATSSRAGAHPSHRTR